MGVVSNRCCMHGELLRIVGALFLANKPIMGVVFNRCCMHGELLRIVGALFLANTPITFPMTEHVIK